MRKLFLIAMVLLTAACHREPQHVAGGPPMPPYKAQWLDGKPFDLAGEKGNVVLLNVWATWCGPCRFEIPDLGKLHAHYASRGFKVIGVSVDEGGAKDVTPFVADQKIVYPIAIDPEGKLATILKADVIPTSVLVDRAGGVVWKHFGIVDTKDPAFMKALESALER
jgi:thiol-disulfide isomerase/thioredoxin